MNEVIEKLKKSVKPKKKVKVIQPEGMNIPKLFDNKAEGDTLYFSRTKNKLVYKTKDGEIKELY